MTSSPRPHSPLQSLERRSFLRLAAAAGLSVPVGVALSSCAASGSSSSSSSSSAPAGKVSDDNPFGVADDAKIDAVVFDGGYGTDYVAFAGTVFEKAHPGTSVKITASTQIAQQMQPRFVGGTPPDLLDNSGANQIAISAIAAELEDLSELLKVKNLEGTVVSDALYPKILDVGLYDGKLTAVNYALTIYAVWYSKALFDANGWQVPKTWDEALALGEKAKAQGKYLFTWGKEAASYYLTLVVDSAIKEGGDEVRLAMDNIAEGAWSLPAVTQVVEALGQAVAAGYMRPGGAGTQFTAAQAQWSQAEEAILYPSGSWIENEMKKQTADGFEMTGAPVPTVTAGSKLPFEAVNRTAGEPFVVASKARSAAGGKEMLRVMLSKEAATNFAKTNLAPTVVKDTVPSDAFGSTALASQTAMLDASGENGFSHNFQAVYGTTDQVNVLFNSFLSGQSDAAALAKGMQDLFDKIRGDDSIKKIKVT